MYQAALPPDPPSPPSAPAPDARIRIERTPLYLPDTLEAIQLSPVAQTRAMFGHGRAVSPPRAILMDPTLTIAHDGSQTDTDHQHHQSNSETHNGVAPAIHASSASRRVGALRPQRPESIVMEVNIAPEPIQPDIKQQQQQQQQQPIQPIQQDQFHRHQPIQSHPPSHSHIPSPAVKRVLSPSRTQLHASPHTHLQPNQQQQQHQHQQAPSSSHLRSPLSSSPSSLTGGARFASPSQEHPSSSYKSIQHARVTPQHGDPYGAPGIERHQTLQEMYQMTQTGGNQRRPSPQRTHDEYTPYHRHTVNSHSKPTDFSTVNDGAYGSSFYHASPLPFSSSAAGAHVNGSVHVDGHNGIHSSQVPPPPSSSSSEPSSSSSSSSSSTSTNDFERTLSSVLSQHFGSLHYDPHTDHMFVSTHIMLQEMTNLFVRYCRTTPSGCWTFPGSDGGTNDDSIYQKVIRWKYGWSKEMLFGFPQLDEEDGHSGDMFPGDVSSGLGSVPKKSSRSIVVRHLPLRCGLFREPGLLHPRCVRPSHICYATPRILKMDRQLVTHLLEDEEFQSVSLEYFKQIDRIAKKYQQREKQHQQHHTKQTTQ